MDPKTKSVEVLNQNYKDYRSLIETQKQRILLSDVKAVAMAGTYFMFQGIIYGQANVNPLSALNGWIPACLLASVAVAFWPAFINTVNECMRTRQQQESAFSEQEKVHRKIHSIRTGRKRDAAAAHQSLAQAVAVVRRQRYAYVGALHFALFLSTLLVLYALLFRQSQVLPSTSIQFFSP